VSDEWSDRDLVVALVKGEAKAVEVILGEAYCAPILRALSARFHLDREDLRQDLLIHLMKDDWACLRKWEGRSALKSYLWTVAIHFCCQRCRIMKRGPRTCALNDCDGRPVEFKDKTQLDPRTATATKDYLAAILRAIEKLPERDRLMMYMLTDERSVAEIAETFRLSLEATRTAIHRARQRLKEILAEGGHDDA